MKESGISVGVSAYGEESPASRGPYGPYGRVLEKVFQDVVEENVELDRQRAAVPQLVSDLLALEDARRDLIVRNSSRYQLWPLVEALLVECRKTWSNDPSQAESLAELARIVAESLSVEGFRVKLLSDLKAEVWSYIANCRRIQSDLRGAEEAFDTAGRLLEAGSGDSMERARYLDLLSSLLRAQRKFSAAAEALSEAIRIYRSLGDRHSEGRAQIKQAKLLADSGKPEEAIPLLKRAEWAIDHQREPRLLLLLKWNLAYHLVDAGKPEDGRALLPEVRDLARQFGKSQDRLRVLWLEGVVRRSLGQVELAEQALAQVREGFISSGIGLDVALVSLDLATLYLETGKTDEVRRLAVETMPIFASRRVQRELLMAWQLFKEAAEKDMATLHLINEVADRIRTSDGSGAASGRGS